MKEYLKIAWRNLWRNRRRTIITIASVLFAVFLALIMRSMQIGTYDYMVESAVKNSTGYIQVHGKGYWEDKSLDNSLIYSQELEEKIRNTPNVSSIVPRLESFALVSYGVQTKGIAVIGTVAGLEDNASGLQNRLVKGNYLSENQKGVLIPEGLADYLKVDIGDSIVLLGQGYHGVTAASLSEVTGIVRFLQPDMNNQLLYMDLQQAQEFYAAPDHLTSVSIMLENPGKLNQTTQILADMDPDNLEVMTWKEMLVELLQYIEGDNISGLFMLGILYLVVGFGILGTILMMTMERRKEFGIMVAVGMKRHKLSLIILIESMVIGILGVLAGILLSMPIIVYFYHHPIQLTGEWADAVKDFNMEPILPFAWEPGFILNQGIVVLIITLLASIYPFLVISRLKVVNAIKGK
ncbi:MAG: FtsX-like permease family protein [Bacteroidales bacterium]